MIRYRLMLHALFPQRDSISDLFSFSSIRLDRIIEKVEWGLVTDSDPSEKMKQSTNFCCFESFNFQRCGMGSSRTAMSVTMLRLLWKL